MIVKTETLNIEQKKTEPKKTFLNITEELIREISKARDEPKWLLDKRLAALKLFNESAMPDFKYGITVKMNAVGLDYGKLDTDALLQKKSIEIDSKKSKEYAKQGIIILDFYEALKQKKYEELIKKYLMTECVKAKDKIVALHAALFSRGLLIYVPKGKQIKGTVEIDFEVDNSLNFDNILLIGEENSKATIVENIFAANNDSNKENIGKKEEDNNNNNNNNNNNKGDKEYNVDKNNNPLQYRSSVVEIIANQSSNLNFCSVQNLNRETFNFSFKTAVIEKDAVFNWVDACMGSKFSHAETTSLMKGSGSRTNNWGMFLADKDQQFGIHANTIHFTHNTISDMLTRGIIADKAKTIYKGLIHIQQPAGQSNGYQRADAVLLSDTAEADVIPMLEIDNSDVRCTHGSTVGQIDKEKLFYLMCRGMDEETARKELIRGFYEQMLARINIKELTGILRAIIYERLGIEQESIINLDK